MKYDYSQTFTIQAAMHECNLRAENGWKLHTILMKSEGKNLAYTMVFEKVK